MTCAPSSFVFFKKDSLQQSFVRTDQKVRKLSLVTLQQDSTTSKLHDDRIAGLETARQENCMYAGVWNSSYVTQGSYDESYVNAKHKLLDNPNGLHVINGGSCSGHINT